MSLHQASQKRHHRSLPHSTILKSHRSLSHTSAILTTSRPPAAARALVQASPLLSWRWHLQAIHHPELKAIVLKLQFGHVTTLLKILPWVLSTSGSDHLKPGPCSPLLTAPTPRARPFVPRCSSWALPCRHTPVTSPGILLPISSRRSLNQRPA